MHVKTKLCNFGDNQMYFAVATWMDIAGGEKDSTKPTVPLFS